MSAGPVALISGSSRGIGKGIAVELAGRGYRVAVTGRDADDVRAAAAEIGGHGFPFDLTDEPAIASCVGDVVRTMGGLDALVVNLGSGQSVPDAAVPLAEMQRVFQLNFFSAVALCNQAMAHLQPGSAIVFIGSIAGCEALGAPLAYGAAKAALLHYMKSLSLLLAPRQIRVNAVSPGNIMFEGGTWDAKRRRDPAAVDGYIAANVPLARFGEPSDVGRAVAFVLDERFMTGHNLVLDGGQTRTFV